MQNPILRDLLRMEQLRLRIEHFARAIPVGGSCNLKRTLSIPSWILVYHCVVSADKVKKFYGRTMVKQCRRYNFLKQKLYADC